MARAATTADAFNAVAEPRRREILDALAGGERPVHDLVGLLGRELVEQAELIAAEEQREADLQTKRLEAEEQ